MIEVNNENFECMKFTYDQMKFISHPEVRTIQISNYRSDIEWAGTRSTQKDPEELKEGFTRRIVKRKHLSLGRFATAHFEIDCSRITEVQLLRHKFLDFCIQSGRYTIHKPVFMLPESVGEILGVDHIQHMKRYTSSLYTSYESYLSLLRIGVPKEDARYVLPQSIITNIAVTGNFQAWYDFLKLRLDKAAQWEIREVANRIKENLIYYAEDFFFEFK